MYVFKFDEKLFEELKDKFNHGDEVGLKQAWKKAVPFVLEENPK
jgi:hypothetical protein